MKQKIVVKFQVRCQKCRKEALRVAAKANGIISSVGLEGENKDRVVVIGDGLDSVELIKGLRKKVGPTEIISVAIV